MTCHTSRGQQQGRTAQKCQTILFFLASVYHVIIISPLFCLVLSCLVLFDYNLHYLSLTYSAFSTELCPTPPFSVLSFLFLSHPALLCSALLIPTLHCPNLHCVELHICTCMRNAFFYRSPTCRIIFPPQPSVLATKDI